MSWPGLIIRVLAVAWFVVVLQFSRMGLSQIGIAPTILAQLAWSATLILPVLILSLAAAKRVDRAASDRWADRLPPSRSK